MFLLGHASVAAAVVTAAKIKSPAVAFGIGFVSHYAVDALPHGDEAVGAWAKRGNEVRRLFAAFLIDGAACAAAFAGLILYRGVSWPVMAAAVGSMAPDAMWGLEKLLHRKIFWRLGKFHERVHNYFHINIPFAPGLALQLLVSASLFAFVFLKS